MKMNQWRILSLALVCMLLVAVLSVPALADEEASPWYFRDEETLMHGGTEYTLYEPYSPLGQTGTVVYYYSQGLGDYRTVYVNSPDAVYARVDGYLYATAEGIRALERLQEGEASQYFLYDASAPSCRVKLEMDLSGGFMKNGEMVILDVRDLENKIRYSLRGAEIYGYYGCTYGEVYYLNGEYYYIHYLDLGNQYFDSDGYFSYRKGEVEAYRLSKNTVYKLLELVSDMDFISTEYVLLDGIDTDELAGDIFNSERGAFVVGMVVFGILLPLPLLIVGLAFPRSHRKGYPKYWYILAGVAALWMALSILLMVIVL